MGFCRFMSLQTLSATGFWATEVNFLVCRLRLFPRALQSPTPAIGPVCGATDIPSAVPFDCYIENSRISPPRCARIVPRTENGASSYSPAWALTSLLCERPLSIERPEASLWVSTSLCGVLAPHPKSGPEWSTGSLQFMFRTGLPVWSSSSIWVVELVSNFCLVLDRCAATGLGIIWTVAWACRERRSSQDESCRLQRRPWIISGNELS